ARVQVSLSGVQILVPGELLSDHGIAGVLRGARAELVSQRVPHDPVVASPVQSGKLEQFAPHPSEALLMAAIFRSEDVCVGILAERKSSLLQGLLEAVSSDVNELPPPRRLLALRLNLHLDYFVLLLFES